MPEKLQSTKRTNINYTENLYDIEITGTAPLIMSKYHNKKPSRKASSSEIAENFLYYDEKTKQLYFPLMGLIKGIMSSANMFKVTGTRSTLRFFIKPYLQPVIKNGDLGDKMFLCHPETDEKLINHCKHWFPFIYSTTNARNNRIDCCLPRIDKWRAKCQLKIIENEFFDEERLIELINIAGKTRGLGALRPDCASGWFGTYQLTKFEKVK